jgi:hypothetical protein
MNNSYKTEFFLLSRHISPFFVFFLTFLQSTYFAPAQCRIFLLQDSVVHPTLSDMQLHVKKPSGVNNPFRIFEEQTKVWIMPFRHNVPNPINDARTVVRYKSLRLVDFYMFVLVNRDSVFELLHCASVSQSLRVCRKSFEEDKLMLVVLFRYGKQRSLSD